eukprot:Skav220435  [mRNA]  locus=scaffold639:1008336:1019518:+ [translate_table: standard]
MVDARCIGALRRKPSVLPKQQGSSRKSTWRPPVEDVEVEAEPPQKVEVSGLWKVFNRHTRAGRCLWTIYGEKPKARPRSPRRASMTPRAAAPAPGSPKRVSPDFSDLCVTGISKHGDCPRTEATNHFTCE